MEKLKIEIEKLDESYIIRYTDTVFAFAGKEKTYFCADLDSILREIENIIKEQLG
jgi:hypothetical protein